MTSMVRNCSNEPRNLALPGPVILPIPGPVYDNISKSFFGVMINDKQQMKPANRPAINCQPAEKFLDLHR
jgi:hypothetical protein